MAKKPVVRPRKYKVTPAKKEKFIQVLSETGNVTHAAKEAGYPRSQWYKVKRGDSEFSEQWDDAIEKGTDALEAEARRRAYEGVNEPVFYKGQRVDHIRRYSDTLLIFLLKGLRPKKYADRHQVDGGDTPIRVEITKFSSTKNEKDKTAK